MKVTRRMNKDNDNDSDDGLHAYFGRLKNIPLLTFEEEKDLSRRIQTGDEIARHRLIEANLRLVVKIARGYLAFGISLMDLIQEGNMGLMRAAEKYDHTKEVRFSTYASWWIRQSISRFLSNKRRIIRLPHRKEEVLRQIKQAYYSLSQVLMRMPRIEEIAAEINVPKADVEFLLSLANDFIPYESGLQNSESVSVVEFHEDYTYSPERAMIRKSSQEATLRVLDRLKDKEKRILIYRYQLNGGREYTLKYISRKLGLSLETVRQIELRALEKLRGQADDLRIYFAV